MKPIVLGISVFLVVTLGIFSFLFGGSVSIKDMLLFTDSLLVVSSIIFGIVGAWLAIIWQNKNQASEDHKDNVKYLKRTVSFAFIVILFSFLTKYLYPILSQIPLLSKCTILVWLRRCVVFLSGISALILFMALLFSLLSFDFFSFNDEIEKQIKNKIDDHIQKTSRKKDKE